MSEVGQEPDEGGQHFILLFYFIARPKSDEGGAILDTFLFFVVYILPRYNGTDEGGDILLGSLFFALIYIQPTTLYNICRPIIPAIQWGRSNSGLVCSGTSILKIR